MKRFANTNYGRKLLFNRILSRDLKSCAFKIDAFYESAVHKQIMSIKLSKDQAVHLGINISFKEETIFSECSEPMLLSVAFRAYFIINYLSCLQIARETEPGSYFSGLVALDAICDLYSNDRKISCVPNVVGKNKQLRPIDVHCAIGAITRVLIENELSVDNETVKRCEAYRDILIAYTGTPEITYLKSIQAQYSVLHEIKTLKSLIAQQPNVLRECALFSQVGIISFSELSIGKLLSICDKRENRFWPGLILRMFALASKAKMSEQYAKYDCMKRALFEFYSNSMECYTQSKEQCILLKDTLRAVQRLTRGVEAFVQYDSGGTIDCMMHYIQ